MGGWVVGSAENRASSVPIELGLGLSLAKRMFFIVAANFIASLPPQSRPNGKPLACAKIPEPKMA